MRTFVARSDPASDVPASKALGPRPDRAAIIDAAADAFGEDPSQWRAGTRQDGGARAVAASLARLRFGYGGRDVARAPGYRNGSSVSRAVRRVTHDRGLSRAAQSVHERLASRNN